MSRTVIAEIVAAPGQEAEFEARLETLAAQVRRESGNLAFHPYRRADKPSVFVIFEEYRDEAAFRAHLAAEHTRTFNAALKTLAEGGESVVHAVEPIGPARSGEARVARGVDHVGVTVPDIEAAARFLSDAFGAVAVYDVLPKGGEPMAGAEVEQQLGLPEGAAIVHMRLMRIGDSATLELFQVEHAPQDRTAGIADLGLTHVALYVDDIAAAASRFESAGGLLLSPVHGLSGVEDGAGNAGVYGRAPWGTLFELLTYPSGIAYPADARTTRWTPAET